MEGTETQQHVPVEQNAWSAQPDYEFIEVGHCSPQNFMSFNVWTHLLSK